MNRVLCQFVIKIALLICSFFTCQLDIAIEQFVIFLLGPLLISKNESISVIMFILH